MLLLAGWGALTVAVVAVGWILVTGLLARSHLNQVRAELPQLRSAITSGNTAKAHALATDIARHAERAHSLSTGPAWWVASNIPGLGTPLQTSRTIAAQADRVGQDVLPGVLSLVDDVSTMHITNSTIDLRQVAVAAPALHLAAQTAHSAAQAVEGSAPSWFGPVSSGRNSVVSALTELDDELAGADRATQILLPMLGNNGQQRYMIGFLNEAESRGLGGIPGAFAIVTADHGKVTFTHFGSDDEFNDVRAKVDLGAEFTARYGQDDPTGLYVNSDVSPNFPDAARIWAAMWQQKSGEHVDGAIAIDPTALSYLLAVVGPTPLPGGGQVSADNVVSLTQQEVYARYPADAKADGAGAANAANAARKRFLTGVATAVAHRLTTGGNTMDLARAAARAAGERRLVVWSSDAPVEATLEEVGYAGVVKDQGRPYAGFVVTNAAGTKLDYYLDRSMTYRRSGCGPSSTAVATFIATNTAPRSGLPAYVTDRADAAPRGAKPGDNRLLITYYASAGARVTAMTVNGVPVPVAAMPENGLVTVTTPLELPAGKSAKITVSVDEPKSDQPVQVLAQPLVQPISVAVSGDRCS